MCKGRAFHDNSSVHEGLWAALPEAANHQDGQRAPGEGGAAVTAGSPPRGTGS